MFTTRETVGYPAAPSPRLVVLACVIALAGRFPLLCLDLRPRSGRTGAVGVGLLGVAEKQRRGIRRCSGTRTGRQTVTLPRPPAVTHTPRSPRPGRSPAWPVETCPSPGRRQVSNQAASLSPRGHRPHRHDQQDR